MNAANAAHRSTAATGPTTTDQATLCRKLERDEQDGQQAGEADAAGR